MKLKNLELQGYKSFANKAQFQFDEGITAVVGPNGSGKSNVADAIRWVLGEQSYSNLRGQRTADMIFAGSSNRTRMGMAYVSLVLDNTDGSIPLDYTEVTIARRAYRSGENEYLINNNRVRLKDVTEVLARSGLARQTYTVIGQGTIDRVLSLRSEDRRQLFEEAAGITYHRQQRTTALKRLDETRDNLVRVNDIVKEIEPRLKRFRRQAERFEQHRVIRQHLDGLLKVWYGFQWRHHQQRLHQARHAEEQTLERLETEQGKLNRLDARIQTVRQGQTELRAKLGDWHAERSDRHTAAETLQREMAVGEERLRQLTNQREEFLSEIERLSAAVNRHRADVQQAEADLHTIDQDVQAAEQAHQTHQAALKSHQQQRETLRYQAKEAEKKAQNLNRTLTQQQARLSQLVERAQALTTQQQEQATVIDNLTVRRRQIETEIGTTQQKLNALTAEVQTAQTDAAKAQTAVESRQQTINKLTGDLAGQEKKLASHQTRLEMLDRLRSDLEGYHHGVRQVLAAKTLRGVRGTIAQLIHVPNDLETAFEVALGSRLQDIVVDSWDYAQSAIQYLKTAQGGRATFLPLDRIRPPKALGQPAVPGVIGTATDLVSFDANIAPAAQSLLNRILVVEDLEAARMAFDLMQGGFQIVTRSGEIVRSGGAVTGGDSKKRRAQGGMLAREREWRQLPKAIAALEQTINTLKQEIDTAREAKQKTETDLVDIQARVGRLSKKQSNVKTEIAKQQADSSDLGKQISWRTDLRAQATAELTANQTRQRETQNRIENLTTEIDAAEAAARELAEQVTAESAESLLNTLNQAKTDLALVRQKQVNQRRLLKNFRHTLNQTESDQQNRQSRVATLAEQHQTIQTQLGGQTSRHQTLVEQLSVFREQIEPTEAILKDLEAEQQKLETTESQWRGNLRRIESEYNHHALDTARRQDELKALQRQIEDDFGMVDLPMSDDQIGQPHLPLESMVMQMPAVETLPEGIEEDIRRLKMQMRRLGVINPDAPREYEELQTRYTFLTDQMADLEKAAKDLKTVIEELNTIMQSSFRQTFEEVAIHFKSYFSLLFGGGEAELRLTEPEDLTNSGVEIMARPPGKRTQSLEMLSGGERSLTAQALIFALLKTSPTPYCVFDEVDAMLDEANVDRFRQALFDLGATIQFIVITHNRKTIEIADTVFGVSMGDDAVSRVVSLRLEDIPETELA